MKPLICVIVPVFNGVRYLAEALASIAAASSVATEAVVVDDGSTDDTPARLFELACDRSLPLVLRTLRLDTNAGPAAARNAAIGTVHSDYLGFLDADDCYAPGALDVLLGRLETNRAAGVAMGRIRTLHSHDGSFAPGSFSLARDSLRCFQLGSILVRSQVLNTVGSLDGSLRHGEDIDWFFRLQEAGVPFDLVDRDVLWHRRHDRNLSDEQGGSTDITRVLAASLRRRRAIAAQRACAVDDLYYVRPDRMRPSV